MRTINKTQLHENIYNHAKEEKRLLSCAMYWFQVNLMTSNKISENRMQENASIEKASNA